MSWNYIRGRKVGRKDEHYHTIDKIIDVITYIWFLSMFGGIFDKNTLQVLWVFTIFRFVGVCLYITTKNRNILAYFPDFVNSTMVVYLFKYYAFPNMSAIEYGICIMAGMVFKMWFETVKHVEKDALEKLAGL